MIAILKDWLTFDKLKVAVPALGTAFAVVFDVGYFAAIDLGYFSLFSLSEHVVFAISAIPAAVFVVVASYGLVGYAAHLAETAVARRSQRYVRYFGYAASAILAVLIVVGAATGSYPLVAVFVVTLLFVLAMTLFGSVGVVAAAALVSVVVAFAAGYAAAVVVRSPAWMTQTLRWTDGTTVKGRLLAAGSRGVLFYDAATKTANFHKWDAFDRIETR